MTHERGFRGLCRRLAPVICCARVCAVRQLCPRSAAVALPAPSVDVPLAAEAGKRPSCSRADASGASRRCSSGSRASRGGLRLRGRLGRHGALRAGEPGDTGHAESVGSPAIRRRSRTGSCCRCSSRSPTIRPSSIARAPTRGPSTGRRSSSRRPRRRRSRRLTSTSSTGRRCSPGDRDPGRAAAGVLPGRGTTTRTTSPGTPTSRTSCTTTGRRSTACGSCSPSFTARAEARRETSRAISAGAGGRTRWLPGLRTAVSDRRGEARP